MLAEFGTVGVAKLKSDNVISNTTNIYLSPNGLPQPVMVPTAVTVFGIRYEPLSWPNQETRIHQLSSVVRIIYRPRSLSITNYDDAYATMLGIADAIIDSWDRSQTLLTQYIAALESVDQSRVTGLLRMTAMDTEPIAREHDWFYSEADHAGNGLPAGFTLDLFFSGPRIAKPINCA